MATGRAIDPWESYARELGHNLLRARAASALSQERAAHAAGISTFTYRKLEKGRVESRHAGQPQTANLDCAG